jgi:NADPH2:quinone reductase
MRAWQVESAGEPREVLALAEVAPPEPSAGLIRVRVRAAGVGLPDVLMCRGSYPLTPPRPFTPGQELVGEVIAVGEGAQSEVGSRVMAVSGFTAGRGSFAEECLALDDFALPVPDEMSDREAAGFLIPFHTAWVGLVRRGAVKPGETLLVLGGAGSSGSAAVQLGVAIGARVIATAGSADKVAFCRRLGASRVIDHRSEDIAAAVREATSGRGADVVYDPVGGAAFQAATRAVAHEGRILAVGFASGAWGQVSTPHLVARNYSVVGVIPGGYDRAFRERAHAGLLGHWRAGALRVPVDRSFSFAELPAALAEVAAGRAVGKLVVEIERP